MALLIPKFHECRFDAAGENRVAKYLSAKLSDDAIIWHNLSVGDNDDHPDFVALDPRYGLWIFEVKDWLLSTIRESNKRTVVLNENDEKINPVEQARRFSFTIADLLKADGQLKLPNGRFPFPWGYGVIFTNISRAAFTASPHSRSILDTRVICCDEVADDPANFIRNIRSWLPFTQPQKLHDLQIQRIRNILDPKVVTAENSFQSRSGDADVVQMSRYQHSPEHTDHQVLSSQIDGLLQENDLLRLRLKQMETRSWWRRQAFAAVSAAAIIATPQSQLKPNSADQFDACPIPISMFGGAGQEVGKPAYAIVTVPALDLKMFPNENAPINETVPSGTKVRIVQSAHDGWKQVDVLSLGNHRGELSGPYFRGYACGAYLAPVLP